MPRRSRRVTGRAIRVTAPTIEVRLGSAFGQLVNISTTGALLRIRTVEPFSLGQQYPMVLDIADAPPRLTVRVIRAERESLDLPSRVPGMSQYLVGVTFAALPALAKHTIATLCDMAYLQPELV